MKKYIFLSLGIVLVGIITSLLFLYLFLPKNIGKPEDNQISSKKEINAPDSSKISQGGVSDAESNESTSPEQKEVKNEDSLTSEKLPKNVLNEAPFIVQAPFGQWDHLHDEACEEASLIIADRYLEGDNSVTKQEAENEIQKMVTWQIEDIGSHKDLNVQEMKGLANDYFGMKLEVIENIGVESFRKNLASENLIIIPLAGREIDNPYYTPPGPLYHVLVIIGYDDSTKEFITHDPGTKHGESLRYDYEILLNNIHDFPGSKDEIKQGVPRALIVE